MHNKIITPIWITFISVLTQGLGEKPAVDIVCGHADKLFEKCFANSNLSDASKVFLQNDRRKIPYSLHEIDENCKIFERGLQCYNEYTEKCMDAMNKRVINNEVEPAKTFYSMLCNDKEFKKDYMMHRDCFRYIDKDLDECTKNYQHVIENEFTRTERERKSNINTQFMHFCCARYSYEQCAFNSAWSKCSATSARFTRRIVEMLSSERQFKKCVNIQQTLCSDAAGTKDTNKFKSYLICLLLSTIVLIKQL